MSKARIMVVEDEGVVALQIKEALEGMGYEVPGIALTGEEAIGKVLDMEPDLVLMDIQLKGGLNGVQAAGRIRARLDVPIVYLTAFSDAETLEQAQLTEPYGYVLKPFEERSLHAIIQMSLAKHRRSRGERENGWWMSAVAASMMESVVICDAKGYVKFINPSAEALFGKRQTEAIEKRMREVVELVDGETRAPLTIPVSEPLLEGKSIVRGNCRVVTAKGTEVPVEFSASPLRSPEGTLFGILFVFREASERERIQNLVLREMEELAKVQKRLLPGPEAAIPGLRVEWFFRPSQFGGGDTIGFFRLDDTHSAFYAADVVGQGILPALSALLLRTFISPDVERGGILIEKRCEEPKRRILPPSEVVRELNRRFFLQDESNPFFTLVYAVVDTLTGITHLARAGHPYPILQRSSGKVELVKPEGYAIGLFPRLETAVAEFLLEPGDRLFLCSDGLVDATSAAGERFSSNRLVEMITAEKGRPLADLVAFLGARIGQWRGSESFDDDVSLLAFEKE
jgi:PAS domain S-box-containing protein